MGKYPIILSDALLGKKSKETYTGIRYNHKPTLSSESAPSSARLKPSAKEGIFNLGFDDQGKKYQYSGTRTSEDGKYVLIFDPARKAFVLHQVDSLFHMNLTRTPTDGNVESLRKQFPHLEVSGSGDGGKQSKAKADKAGASAVKPTGAKTAAGKGKGGKSEAAASKAKADKSKAEKSKPVALTLPTAGASASTSASASKPATPPPPAPEKKSRRAKSPVDSEEDTDDDDFGLTIEYPGGPPSNNFHSSMDFSPAFPAQRRFSEFVRDREDEGQRGEEEEEEDAGLEDDELYPKGDNDEESEAFKLPSPVDKNRVSRPPIVEQSVPVELPERFTFSSDADSDADADADADADMEMAEVDADGDPDVDLDEEALLMEFQGGDDGNESDSSVSEEE